MSAVGLIEVGILAGLVLLMWILHWIIFPKQSRGLGFLGALVISALAWRPLIRGVRILFGELYRAALALPPVEVPVQFIQMIPYVVTIIVLAGFIGQSRAPKAIGIPYEKER